MNLKALSGRVIVKALDQYRSDILVIPEQTIERAGNLTRCQVVSSGVDDIPEEAFVHCFSHLGYRIPLSDNLRIYLLEDIVLIEDFPPHVNERNGDDVTSLKKSKSVA